MILTFSKKLVNWGKEKTKKDRQLLPEKVYRDSEDQSVVVIETATLFSVIFFSDVFGDSHLADERALMYNVQSMF